MTAHPLFVTDADVNAYVDGQLAPACVPAVEDAIVRDSVFVARVVELRVQNTTLHNALNP